MAAAIPRHERHLRQCFPGRACGGSGARIDAGARKASPASSSLTFRPISCATDFDHKELLGLADFASQHWNPKMKEEGISSLARYAREFVGVGHERTLAPPMPRRVGGDDDKLLSKVCSSGGSE
ncbi:hypothetical protein QA640_20670 [Bradyrhizobium sp. CB82]|uniref:hypothetical protein n=1 Tax=Bradyrhizobium sp. CB82 TaxID=3039159 RepID=UPI0024B1138F|nr:hypothetical protein [Bradyrhizobium sp. CB82]WFU44647.1 hypothetical protein QA640_20670 [Bradyrhizobium sp. CB82]